MSMSNEEAKAILEAMNKGMAYFNQVHGETKKSKKRAKEWTETQEVPLQPQKKQKPKANSQVLPPTAGRGRGRGSAGSATRGRGRGRMNASQACPTCGHVYN